MQHHHVVVLALAGGLAALGTQATFAHGALDDVVKVHEGTMSPILEPDTHLTCYEIRAPQRTKGTSLDMRNRIAVDNSIATAFEWLCLPSRKPGSIPGGQPQAAEEETQQDVQAVPRKQRGILGAGRKEAPRRGGGRGLPEGAEFAAPAHTGSVSGSWSPATPPPETGRMSRSPLRREAERPARPDPRDGPWRDSSRRSG